MMAHETSIDSCQRSLLASIHDASPLTLDEVERLHSRLARHLDPACIAMLVIPDHWHQARIRSGTTFAARLRSWAEEGNEIFLHGWSHLDTGGAKSPGDRLRARFMTAREGEFLGLGKEQALGLLRDGKALIEDVTGHAIAGFVAPAWLYDANAMEAIAELGFPLCEDHWRVWEPASGRRVATGPVVTWASRSWLRVQSSVGFASLARHALKRMRTLRVAVHPGDLSRDEIMQSIDTTLGHLMRDRAAIRYADLPGMQPASSPVAELRQAL